MGKGAWWDAVHGVAQSRTRLKRRSSSSREGPGPTCCCLVTQSCPTLCNSMDCSPPGSSVHGILQARILEWVATSFSRESHMTDVFLRRGNLNTEGRWHKRRHREKMTLAVHKPRTEVSEKKQSC